MKSVIRSLLLLAAFFVLVPIRIFGYNRFIHLETSSKPKQSQVEDVNVCSFETKLYHRSTFYDLTLYPKLVVLADILKDRAIKNCMVFNNRTKRHFKREFPKPTLQGAFYNKYGTLNSSIYTNIKSLLRI